MKTKFIFFMLMFSVFNSIQAQEVQTPDFEDLRWAVERGDRETVYGLVFERQTPINGDLFNGDTLLHLVCRNPSRGINPEDCVGIINILLEAGADINAKNKLGQMPLYTLASLSRLQLPLSDFSMLFERTYSREDYVLSSIDFDNEGNTLLHQIVKAYNDDDVNLAGTIERIDYLLDKVHAMIDARNAEGQAPLYLAIPSPRLFMHLLDAGAYFDVALTGRDGSTYLHQAVYYREFPVIAKLLQEGADPNLPNAQGQTPLHIATMTIDNFNLPREDREIKLEIVALLMQNGGHIHVPDNEGWTPFLQIVAQDDRELYRDFMLFVTNYGSVLFPGNDIINFHRGSSEEIRQEQQ